MGDWMHPAQRSPWAGELSLSLGGILEPLFKGIVECRKDSLQRRAHIVYRLEC